jgi:hypothetical protein
MSPTKPLGVPTSQLAFFLYIGIHMNLSVSVMCWRACLRFHKNLPCWMESIQNLTCTQQICCLGPQKISNLLLHRNSMIFTQQWSYMHFLSVFVLIIIIFWGDPTKLIQKGKIHAFLVLVSSMAQILVGQF